MPVDLVAALDTDIQNDGLQPALRDLYRRTAHPAHDVVVVFLRSAGDVCVFAGGQVKTLEGALLGEQVKGSKHRRPADFEAAPFGIGQEVCGGEMTVSFCYQRANGAARRRFTHVDTRSH